MSISGETATSSARAGRAGVGFLILAGALSAVLPMSLDFYLPAFPQIAEQFGTDVGQVQLSLSAALLGFSVGQLAWGPLTDRYGRNRPLLVGLAVFVLASFGCAFAPTFTALMILRLVQALGGCVAVVGSRAMARDLYSGQSLARALSLIFLIFGVAPVLSPALGAILLTWWSWQAMFISLGVFGAACFVGVALFGETLPIERRLGQGVGQAMRSFGKVLRAPTARRAAAVSFLTGAALFSWVAVAPAALLETSGLSRGGFIVVFGLVSLTIVVMSQVNAALLRRVDVHQLLFRCVALMAVAALVLLAATLLKAPFWLLVVLLGCTVCFVGAIFANVMAVGLEPFAALAGAAAGVLGTVQTLGGAVSSALLAGLAIPGTVAMALGLSIPMVIAIPIARKLRNHAEPADL